MSIDVWSDYNRALLALLIICGEADEQEAKEQFPPTPGASHNIKRRAAEWLASRLSFPT